MKISSFRELLARRADPDMKDLIKSIDDNSLIEFLCEVLEKSYGNRHHKVPNEGTVAFGENADPEMANLLHDSLVHHATMRNAALKAGNQTLANQHLKKVFDIAHLVNRISRDSSLDHTNDRISIKAANPRPWERNATKNVRRLRGFSGWGIPKDSKVFEGNPHPDYESDTKQDTAAENYPHSGAYPIENISLIHRGPGGKKIQRFVHVDKAAEYPQENLKSGEMVPHLMDSHPIFQHLGKVDSPDQKFSDEEKQSPEWQEHGHHYKHSAQLSNDIGEWRRNNLPKIASIEKKYATPEHNDKFLKRVEPSIKVQKNDLMSVPAHLKSLIKSEEDIKILEEVLQDAQKMIVENSDIINQNPNLIKSLSDILQKVDDEEDQYQSEDDPQELDVPQDVIENPEAEGDVDYSTDEPSKEDEYQGKTPEVDKEWLDKHKDRLGEYIKESHKAGWGDAKAGENPVQAVAHARSQAQKDPSKQKLKEALDNLYDSEEYNKPENIEKRPEMVKKVKDQFKVKPTEDPHQANVEADKKYKEDLARMLLSGGMGDPESKTSAEAIQDIGGSKDEDSSFTEGVHSDDFKAAKFLKEHPNWHQQKLKELSNDPEVKHIFDEHKVKSNEEKPKSKEEKNKALAQLQEDAQHDHELHDKLTAHGINMDNHPKIHSAGSVASQKQKQSQVDKPNISKPKDEIGAGINKMVEQHLPFINHQVKAVMRGRAGQLPSGIEEGDLKQAAIHGFLTALHDHVPGAGAKLKTSSAQKIQGSVKNFIAKDNKHPISAKHRKEADEYEQKITGKPVGQTQDVAPVKTYTKGSPEFKDIAALYNHPHVMKAKPDHQQRIKNINIEKTIAKVPKE